MSKILFILILSLSAIADTFTVQSDSSNINFSVDKFLFISVDGKFSKFKGNINLNENNTIESIYGIVNASSVNTGNESRDKDLNADGYFNSTKHQYIDFKAISVNEKEIEATISIKGITKKVIFSIDRLEVVDAKVTLVISSILKREDFMLNGAFSSVIANNVKVSAALVAYRLK